MIHEYISFTLWSHGALVTLENTERHRALTNVLLAPWFEEYSNLGTTNPQWKLAE